MTITKIPKINTDFDLDIFLQIVKKKYWLIMLLLLLAVLGSFLYLRYTQPLYQSEAIIQINESNKSTLVLDIKDVYSDDDISKTIELLRSNIFLEKALSKLPLQVSYHVQGKFLSTELYKSTPFIIEYGKNVNNLYEKQFFVEFDLEKNEATLIYNKQRKTISVGDWHSVYGDSLRCTITNIDQIRHKQQEFKNNIYFFIVHNPKNLLKRFNKKININLLSSSAKTIKISYVGNNGNATADIANTIANEYIKYDVELKKESTRNILRFIEQQLNSIYKELSDNEQDLLSFKKNNKIKLNNEAKQGAYALHMEKLNQFETNLLQIDFELLNLTNVSQQISTNSKINVYEIISLFANTQSEKIASGILKRIEYLQSEKEKLLNKVTDDNLQVQTLDKQIDNQKTILCDFVKSSISRLKIQKEDYKQQIALYKKQLFNNKTYDEVELRRLQRMYEINEGFYNQLVQKKAEILIAQAGYVSKNRILENAEANRVPITPNKKDIYIVFLLIGLMISFVVIIIQYLLYDTITSVHTISNYTQAPILGTIPQYKNPISVSQLLVHKKPNSIFTESFRTIRSNFQFISHGADTKIITVTSTVATEGKTFTAINLGGIIALNDKKVIVIDLDLRKPRIHQGFGVENDKGVSTILINRNNVAECIRHTDIDNFDYITAGPVPPNPSELINGKNMQVLLDELDQQYDVIIIDTSPVGLLADAVTSMQKANYPIYVMKANYSKRNYIDNINRLIELKQINNLSIILNGVEADKSNYGYGYGGYYGDDEVEVKGFWGKIKKKLNRNK